MTGYSSAEWAAYRAGLEAGYGLGADETVAQLADQVGRRLTPARPTELDTARWSVRGEPRTRATFGEPRRDDYPGRPRQIDMDWEAAS